MFGPGFQCIPIAVPIQLFLVLQYVHMVHWLGLGLLWAALTVGTTLAYLHIFALVPVFAAAVNALLVGLVLAPIRSLKLRCRVAIVPGS